MFSNAKMPKPPDRPLIPYMRYSRKMWAKVRSENPDAQLWDISKIIGQMWREVPDHEKSVFQHEYDIEKVEYEKLLKNYQNSAAYQSYANQKNAQSAKAQHKMSRSRADVGGVVIQPVDEDLENNELSARRLAAIRFDRNHRLIAELLSSNMVNDTRTVVAQQRIELLKKQADSLIMHQKKLEVELTKMDEVYNEKKRALEDASEDFAEKLKKVCDEKVVVEQNKYDEMVEEWTGKLATAYEEYKKKQTEMEKELAAKREKMVEKTPVLYNLTIGDDEEKEKNKEEAEKAEKEEEKKEEEKTIEENKEEDKKVEEEGEKKDEEKEKEEEKKGPEEGEKEEESTGKEGDEKMKIDEKEKELTEGREVEEKAEEEKKDTDTVQDKQ